jgi:CheY-like chemotaxis protein
MDLLMPVLDGVAATARIRHFERQHSQSPSQIVALTSEHVSWNALRAHGLDAFMFKPYDALDLQECIQRCCPRLVLR